MKGRKSVLALLAHPDDAEFMCAGALALLREKDWEIHIATMTAGDCGSTQHSREEIGHIRRREAERSADILNGTYYCLNRDDIFIMYDRETLTKVIRLLRAVKPAIVFAPSPSDYMIDHETTSTLAQTACFASGMPNIAIEGVKAFEPVPCLYYVDAVEGRDKFGSNINPSIIVDITSTMDTKERMLSCHESQREWLRAHHCIDEYILSMKRFAELRGEIIHRRYAEGFRQHLGHGFPHVDVLPSVLGDVVYPVTKEDEDGTKIQHSGA